MAIFNTSDLLKSINTNDFSQAFYVANPTNSVALALLKGLGKVEPATDIVVSKVVRTLDKTKVKGSQKEGFKPSDFTKTAKSLQTNVCEIYNGNFSVSGSALAINGMSSEVQENLKDVLDIIAETVDANIFYGVYAGTEGESNGRQMKGLTKLVTASEKAKTGLSEADFETAFVELYNSKMTKNVVMFVNPANKKLIDSIFIDTDVIRQNVTAGSIEVGVSLNRFYTHLGYSIDICVDANITVDEIVIADLDKVVLKELRPMKVEQLGKTSDSEEFMAVTELSILASPLAVKYFKLTTTP